MTASLFPDLIVNGEVVPHTLVAAEVQNHAAPSGKPGIAWRKAANAVAVRTLLLQEARRRGLVAHPAEVGPGRFETEEEALIRDLLDQTVNVDPPGDEAIRAEWSRDPTRFRTPPLWEVSHILMACDPRDPEAKSAALARAVAVQEELRDRPGDFARLAARHSDCGSRMAGGALGQLGPGDTVPEFEAALRGLAERETTSAPVLTRHGYHIIRMDALALGAELPFETVQPRIATALEKAAWSCAARDFISNLVAGAKVTGAELGAM
ncbi:peptidylprolyl isomerase [Neotabrizicola sp. sgz301269]|uniref:peptidylprolyl isomerase n=1 Tax=Neotabrizicola sp. sgz301269 TaxID=3276282 RepID=UPI00376FF7A8